WHQDVPRLMEAVLVEEHEEGHSFVPITLPYLSGSKGRASETSELATAFTRICVEVGASNDTEHGIPETT
ncbi:hypothetical protein U1Q18_037912, partial [Sarracenia purpurea var. burkii]